MHVCGSCFGAYTGQQHKSEPKKWVDTTSQAQLLLHDQPRSFPECFISNHINEWTELLQDDPDKDYLIDGITNVFVLHDLQHSSPTTPYPAPSNYCSTKMH